MSPIMPARRPVLASVFTLTLVAGLALAQPQPQPGAKPAVQPVPAPAPTTVQPTPPTDDPAAPNFPLKFDHTSFDWGDIPDTEKVNHIFKFTNGSDRTVSISGLVGSCGCTGGTLTKNDYAPGEAGEITATFDPNSRVGPQPKTLTVNLKEGGAFVLHVTSNVKPYVFIDQQKLQFMDIMKGTETSQGFLVIGRAADFAVTGLEVANPDVLTAVAEAPEITTENNETLHKVHVRVTLKPTLPIGVASSQITVKTNDVHKPTLQAIATAVIVGELRAAPQSMYIRQNQPSIPFESEIQLDNRLSKPFEINSIDVEGPSEMQLVVDFNTIATGPGFMIKLSGVTPPVPGQYRGTVIVKTSVADEAEMKLNFIANVVNAQGIIPNVVPPKSAVPQPTTATAVPTTVAPPVKTLPSGH